MQPRGKSFDRAPASQDKFVSNEAITAPRLFVIGAEGQQLGVMLRADALRIAEQEGLDLVAVAPDADPPVCRLLDYGKLKYKEQKRAAEARKKSATRTVKELQVRYRTDKHDIETKVRNARKFLEAGDKVRFQMRFKGREVVYADLGRQVFDQIAAQLGDVAVVEEFSPLLNQRMGITLSPKSSK